MNMMLLDRGERLVAGVRALNYRRLIAHDPREVEKLQQLLRELDDMELQPASAIATSLQGGQGNDDETRHEEIVEELCGCGFDERMGRVYDSFAQGRSRDISEVPHDRGMPVFDTVVAADFSPVSGMHGIFISKLEVASAVLPAPGEANEWQVLARRHYTSLEEMREFVILMSAGFELP